MQAAELSVIFPIKNIEKEISGVLSFITKQTDAAKTEFILIDMGSEDRSVFQSVRLMKQWGLHGFVIQNGNSTVSAALNTGIQKAGGDYLTFVFARRLYDDYIRPFLDTAKRAKADFVFGCVGKNEARSAERRSVSSAIRQPGGNEYFKDIIRRVTGVDISAIVVRRGFLQEKQVSFYDMCRYGYSNEFICRCLLYAPVVAQSPLILQRNHEYELRRDKQTPVGNDIFQRVEAALRVLDAAKLTYGNDTELIRLIERVKLPSAVMNAIDVMLREGASVQSVRTYLQVSGYSGFLPVDKRQDSQLRNRILTWKTLPWLYKPS